MFPGQQHQPSLLDYGVVDNEHVNIVTSFAIDAQARFRCGSDHALLQADISLSGVPRIQWTYHDAIHYNFRENSCFKKYQLHLDEQLSKNDLKDFKGKSTEDMLQVITSSITSSAMSSFGIRVKKRKKGFKLPKPIVETIREKDQLQDQLNSVNCPDRLGLETSLNQKKEKIKESIKDYKFNKRTRLRSQLLLADPNRKRFWRLLKYQIKTAGSITALRRDDKLVFEQSEIEDTVLSNHTWKLI